MGDGKYAMVAPWMENGNIIEFLRGNFQANPLKLVRAMFYLTHLLIEFGRSWRTQCVVFSISMAWSSPTVT